MEAEHDEVVREAEEAVLEIATAAAEATADVPQGPVPVRAAQPRRRGRRTSVAAAAEADASTPLAEPGAPAESGPGAPPGLSVEDEGVAPASDEAGASGEEVAAPKRRRRGARGGRSAREPRAGADEGAPTPDGESADASLETRAAPKGAKASGSRASTDRDTTKARPRDRRRPRAIVRQDEGSGLATPMTAPSPGRLGVVADQPKRKIILVTDDGQELRVALVEDGRLAEIYIERPDKKSYLGDIYQGKVENVLGGIDAAFVDFGLEKNGFLYVDEVTAPEGEKRARRIADALKNGQQVLVQVTKDPMGQQGCPA